MSNSDKIGPLTAQELDIIEESRPEPVDRIWPSIPAAAQIYIEVLERGREAITEALSADSAEPPYCGDCLHHDDLETEYTCEKCREYSMFQRYPEPSGQEVMAGETRVVVEPSGGDKRGVVHPCLTCGHEAGYAGVYCCEQCWEIGERTQSLAPEVCECVDGDGEGGCCTLTDDCKVYNLFELVD